MRSKSKITVLLRNLLIMMTMSAAFVCLAFSSIAQAADIQAQLDSNNGNSGFTIENSSSVGVDRIDSNGNVGIGTTTSQTLLYVSPQGVTPEYAVGAGDAYIQNNLEVDGTTYLNDVYINGLEVNGLTLGPGPLSMGSLTVTGETYLATSTGNVGIGTVTPLQKLDVRGTVQMAGLILTGNGAANGNVLVSNSVGVGTWMPASALGGGGGTAAGGLNAIQYNSPVGTFAGKENIFSFNGTNVGIGTSNGRSSLDVLGTIRTMNLTMSGQAPVAGYVLTASDSSGDTVWSSAGGVSGWTVSGNNVYQTYNGNVGIGTNLLTTAALTVMNGNVGIGTWAPGGGLVVMNGNVGIGINSPVHVLDVKESSPTGLVEIQNTNASAWSSIDFVNSSGAFIGSIGSGNPTSGGYANQFYLGSSAAQDVVFQSDGAERMRITSLGNVGIGSTAPGQILDVQGTIRTTNLTMSGQSPIIGYVLTASDSAGDTTWTAPSAVGGSGWTVTGNNVYETAGGNVGIGTTLLTTAALTVMNGNVGIGTWVPVNSMDISGNTAIGSGFAGTYAAPPNGLLVQGNVGIGTSTPTHAFSIQLSAAAQGIGSIRNMNSTGYSSIDYLDGTTGNLESVFGYANPGVNNPGYAGKTYIQSAVPFYINAGSGMYFDISGNTGIGTITPLALLEIGARKVDILSGGNVGIGSINPSQLLDVQGTVRTTGLTMSGSNPISGYVLTASDSAGDTTWTAPSAVGGSGWTVTGNNVYETAGGNVGIGTTLLTTAALTVMNGNVGIGTWVPGGALIVQGGNVGIGTTAPWANLVIAGSAVDANTALSVVNAAGAARFSVLHNGSVGIGAIPSASVANLLVDLNTRNYYSYSSLPSDWYVDISHKGSGGGVSSLGGTQFISESASASSGQNFVFAQQNGAGTATVAMVINNYGNVGIGTTTPVGGLAVMNGNVGIGTWVPSYSMTVTAKTPGDGVNIIGTGNNSPEFGLYSNSTQAGGIGLTLVSNAYSPQADIGDIVLFNSYSSTGNIDFATGNSANPITRMIVTGAGNVGIGSLTPGQALDVTGTVRTIGFTMSGASPISGYVLTASDSAGDTIWSSAGGVSGWTVVGNNVYETGNGNVGIGTSLPAAYLDVSAVNPNAVDNIYWRSGTSGNILGILSDSEGASGDSGVMILNSAGAATVRIDGRKTASSYFNTGGNVGIGSTAPGQTLDVLGTIRTTNFTMSGQTPVAGYVLTASDSAGDTVWSSAGGVSGWTVLGNNVYETGGGNVGIGTNMLTTAALTVMNGNVGIGTWVPGSTLQVTGNVAIGSANALSITNGGPSYYEFGIDASSPIGISKIENTNASGWSSFDFYDSNNTFIGSVGIGNPSSGNYADKIYFGSNAAVDDVFQSSAIERMRITSLGNVGIGSAAPGQSLDVSGTVRTTNFTMSGQAPTAGYVLTASDSAGDTVWSSAGGVSGWTVLGNNVYETGGGNVGIGTNLLTTAALTVMNGNVGIGTWVPVTALDVNGSITVRSAGVGSQAISLSSGNDVSIGGHVHSGYGMWVRSTTARSYGMDQTSLGSATGLSLYSNSIESLSINNFGNVGIGTTTPVGGLAVMNGNVGIGTWMPARALDVAGVVNATNGFNVSNNSMSFGLNGANNLSLGNSAGVLSLSSTILSLGSSTTTQTNMYGNVGIGSTAPGQALDVTGTVRTTNFTMSGQAPTAGYVLTASDSAGDTTWSSAGGVSGWTISGNNVYETGNGNVGIGTNLLNTAALTVMNGNVGIGTWVPSQALQVTGNILVTGQITNNTNQSIVIQPQGVSGVGNVILNTDSGLNAIRAVGHGNPRALIGSGTDDGSNNLQVFGTSTMSGNVGIGTTTPVGGLAVMNGNVGIGTWVPASPLHVIGTIRSDGASNTGEIDLYNGATKRAMFADQNTDTYLGTITGQALYLGADNTSSVAVFNGGASGAMAVNTLTAQSQTALTVEGQNTNSGWYAMQAIDSSSNPLFAIRNDGRVGIGTTLPSGLLEVGIQKFDVLSGGNVGIGTISPLNTLHVAGTNGGAAGIYLNNAVPSATTFTLYNNAGTLTWNGTALATGSSVSGTTNYIPVFTGSSSLGNSAFYQLNGNIGIGTTTPGQSLDVRGTVSVTNFTMSGQAPVAGYVLTASDSAGDTTWSSAGGVSGWTVSGNNVYETGNGNVGIGTNLLTTAALTVMNGNVGIGTWVPRGALEIEGGNVGIGVAPNGVFSLSTQAGANFGGDIYLSGGMVFNENPWVINENSHNGGFINGDVGIGTTTPQGALVVTNGNVGIGTWTTGDTLDVVSSSSSSGIDIQNLLNNQSEGIRFINDGNSPIGTIKSTNIFGAGTNEMAGGIIIRPLTINSQVQIMGYTGAGAYPAGIMVQGNGNVGIGSLTPGQALDVNGTVRTINFTMGGQSPISGYVLTASDSAGDTTWSSAGGVSGWTVTGNNVYETGNGNVGIGTNLLTTAALTVMNGNVGIGTWVPDSSLNVVGGGVVIGSYPGTAATANLIVGASNLGNYADFSNTGITGKISGSGVQNWITFGISTVSLGANGGTNNLVVNANGTEINGSGTGPNTGNALIVNSGNVGIGSTAPGQILDVQGTIRASGNVGIGSSITDSGGTARLTITSNSVEVNLQ